jgi:hypothetical protein
MTSHKIALPKPFWASVWNAPCWSARSARSTKAIWKARVPIST